MIERKIKRARMTIALPKIFIMLSALFNISLEAAEVSVLKPLASCAEPADIVTTIALNLQSRFVS